MRTFLAARKWLGSVRLCEYRDTLGEMACSGLVSKAPSGAVRFLSCCGQGHEGNSWAAFLGRAGRNQIHSRMEPHYPPLGHA